MAATTLPVPTGLPSPRSPTLSDACMILPEVDALRSLSPSPYVERPPSPSSLLYSHSNRSTHSIKLASAPQGRRGPSPQIKSPPLSTQSSRSTLRTTMTDSDVASKKHRLRDDVLASSPTIGSSLPTPTMDNNWQGNQQRRMSNTSSLHSEDLENMKWPGFDGPGGFDFDDSGVVLDDAEEHDQFPITANGEEDMDNDRWFDGQSDAEDDMYSSAALSRRAEIILANAKKRLNVMEGNLRGARQSLVVSPTFNTMKMASELSHQLSAARERDRRLYGGIGPIPPRTKQYYSSPLSANGNSPGHSRVLSETSVPAPFPPSNFSRINPGKRASSAMGLASGPWSPECYGQGRFPIRESRSYEVMRERRGTNEDQDHSLRSYSRGSKSPPNTLETLKEDDDGSKLRRSESMTTDLRSQMNDLKGRISSLKQRAKEDHLRRRSLQSLRTPSPFTSAEIWYAGAQAYKSGGSPVTADAGVGIKTESPVRKALYEDEESSPSTPRLTPSESPRNVGSPKETNVIPEQQEPEDIEDYPTSHYEDAEDFQLEAPQAEDEGLGQEKDEDDMDDIDFVSVEGEDAEPQGDSVYEDAVYEMPVAARHEDRVDAFDYEHFFLHSAMGTYSSASRRSSSSSGSSVATTRPVTTAYDRQASTNSVKRISLHQRNSSVDSVSTIASFATAAEEQSDEEDDNNEVMDQFSQQFNHTVTQRNDAQHLNTSPRSDSAINMRANGTKSPGQTSTPRGPSPPDDLASGLQTSKLFSTLLETPPSKSKPKLALNEEEKQLVYSLAASFQQVCTNLQSVEGDQYERKEWRRRLDEARRVLNGEEFHGQPF
ncbi:uncharacterized protein BDR25DRAFT_298413 [Lindgomyces ingoldianus]|uniref:Uncharacterized protein n=1 Tax=Lindgomyces ingoldianus TaxID=673940 RepID=A0ACB6Q8B0_9PLEO|nr:uncharacterized protein BDR25DRAFT_298413 [Lindgomyces ingoldianus]KAF2463158.1 hypothetical protein BDR25DRAFT_298413 [Lindgomyces ingoldianus]